METKSMSDEVEITRRKLTTGGEEKFDLGAALDALQAKDLRKQDALAVLDLPKGCHAFDDKQIRGTKQVLIVQAQRIIAQYRERGFTLTLRQLFYQFVAQGLLPNQQREYDRLGAAVTDGRRHGLIAWDAIEDRTRHRTPLCEDSNTDFDGIMESGLSVVGDGYSENL
jgi:hypothetical protein